MFQRILVPLDGSERAEEAIPLAAYLARTTGASLFLLRVVPLSLPYVGTYPYSWEAPILQEETQEHAQTRAHDYLSRVVLTQHLDDIHHEIEVLDGTPVPCISQFVREQHIDLVVMRSHGATGIKRWLLGSVAQGIVRHCPASALIVRDAVSAPTIIRPDKLPQQLRILVPLNGTHFAESALLPAAQLCAALASPGQGTVHLTQTVHSIGEEGGKHKELVAKLNQDTLTEAEAYLKNVAQRFYTGDLAEFHLQVTSSVVPHSNATEIWKRIVEEAMGTAQTPSCDIIAMATHGRHGLQHLLEGSVTESVLDASVHPLLVVHNQDEETKEETLEEAHHAR